MVQETLEECSGCQEILRRNGVKAGRVSPRPTDCKYYRYSTLQESRWFCSLQIKLPCGHKKFKRSGLEGCVLENHCHCPDFKPDF